MRFDRRGTSSICAMKHAYAVRRYDRLVFPVLIRNAHGREIWLRMRRMSKLVRLALTHHRRATRQLSHNPSSIQRPPPDHFLSSRIVPRASCSRPAQQPGGKMAAIFRPTAFLILLDSPARTTRTFSIPLSNDTTRFQACPVRCLSQLVSTLYPPHPHHIYPSSRFSIHNMYIKSPRRNAR